MVAKRNINRKKNLKEDSKPKVEEKKPQVSIDQIIQGVTQKVISELKPDIDLIKQNTEKQLNAISEQLAKQIATEVKDIRSNLSQQPQPDMQSKADVLSQPEMPTGEMPTGQPQPDMPTDQQQPINLTELLVKAGLQLLAPRPQSNQAMFQTFEQASIRKNMADMSMDDYINKAVKQQVVKKILGTGFDEAEYKKAELTADHYMKPLRDVGVNAQKEEQLKHMQEEREKSHEL